MLIATEGWPLPGPLSGQNWGVLLYTHTYPYTHIYVYISITLSPHISPVAVYHYGFHFNLFTLHISKSLLWRWKTWLPLSLICLLIWFNYLHVTNLLLPSPLLPWSCNCPSHPSWAMTTHSRSPTHRYLSLPCLHFDSPHETVLKPLSSGLYLIKS